MPGTTKVEEGSGNIFADIGLPNPKGALAKAEIARQVNRVLIQRKLSQVQAGALLRIAQPRVSDLARGRLGKFSLEKLLLFARLTGIDVEIRMKPSSKPGLKVKTRAAWELPLALIASNSTARVPAGQPPAARNPHSNST